MKSQSMTRDILTYQSPEFSVLELSTEGVLCESGLDSSDVIPDMQEDYLTW